MMFRGRVHHISNSGLIASKGRHIYVSKNLGDDWLYLASVPVSILAKLKTATYLGRRLFRADIHHIIPCSPSSLTVFAFGKIYLFDQTTRRWNGNPQIVNGSKPIVVCRTKNFLYYGQYFANPNRLPARIYASEDNGRSWKSVYEFVDVRHVHGIFSDPWSDSLWITTGDDDEECGIWKTDNKFSSMQRVLGGSQQFRAVQLVFAPDYIYFGTDTPREQNFIYRFSRDLGEPERLFPVASSVFFGTRVGRRIFFSTVCEPSSVNETRMITLLASDESGSNWQTVTKLQKDRWPMTSFQHGQLFFPQGDSASPYLWYTPFAVNHDQTTWRVHLEEIDG